MQNPAAVSLYADRWTPFVVTLEFTGLVLTGATFAMQVRQTFDAEGAPLVALGTVGSSSAEGVYIVSATQAQIRINESTMEGLLEAPEEGDDLKLYYDLHITPAGGTKQVYLRGPFIVRGGATQ